MKFIQFLRPDARTRPAFIERPKEIEDKAAELVKRGYWFEIEELANGMINMDCQMPRNVGSGAVCGEFCSNGPAVPDHVDKMVNRAYSIVVEGKKTDA